jgi:methylthioribose-1-phosphate isomerase
VTDYYTIRWNDGVVRMIDQRLLPQEEIYRDYYTHQEVAQAIHTMVIRGAPAIGAAAGFGMALMAMNSQAQSIEEMVSDLHQAATVLKAARPTAVNLTWALERIISVVNENLHENLPDLINIVITTAQHIADEDVIVNQMIGQVGNVLVPDGANIIHHCNTGALATVGYGTALGVIRCAHESGKQVHVYVDETRPRLQGARLTSWELLKLGVPHTVIVDGASGHIMRTKKIDLCLVGCDRIAANGDVANKIGTYNLAIAANFHHVPFYSVGPTSTLDLSTSYGDEIPIEERDAGEVACIGEQKIIPNQAKVYNPAFDITPAKLITGIITEKGIAKPPYLKSLRKITQVYGEENE